MSVINYTSYGHGFFSCCTNKLIDIVDYINSNSKIPDNVDSSSSFLIYKPNTEDVTYTYFEHYEKNELSFNKTINFDHNYQLTDYSYLDYDNIIPLIKKYFSPSKQIIDITKNIVDKYNIDYDNTIAVYYRGTDKQHETQTPSFDDFYTKIDNLSGSYVGGKLITGSLFVTNSYYTPTGSTISSSILIVKENNVGKRDSLVLIRRMCYLYNNQSCYF